VIEISINDKSTNKAQKHHKKTNNATIMFLLVLFDFRLNNTNMQVIYGKKRMDA